jgi:Kef-type K+ transport system membrane component KefB
MVAVLGVIIPFFAGWGLLSAWGGSQVESIFLGASMVATSVGITAQVLASKGLLSQEASNVILTAAVIDDVLGLLVLAVVSGMARGSLKFLDISITLVIAVSFVLVIAIWGRHAMNRVVPRVEEKLQLAEAEFAFSICLLFALALLATEAGVAAIVGAFLAGMALGESVGPRVHTLVQGATELLVPFFLVGLGLQIKLEVFKDASVMTLALAVFAVAVVTKLLGCGFGALGMGGRNALRVGVGMIPRGEVGMVVARLGLAMGILTDKIYGVVVFMAVATTLIAPPLIKMAFRGDDQDKSFVNT